MKYDISWTSIFSLNNSPLCFHHQNFPVLFPGISVFLQVLHMTSWCFQAPNKIPHWQRVLPSTRNIEDVGSRLKGSIYGHSYLLGHVDFLENSQHLCWWSSWSNDDRHLSNAPGAWQYQGKDSLFVCILGWCPTQDASGHQAFSRLLGLKDTSDNFQDSTVGTITCNTFWNDFSDSIDSGTLEVVNSPPKKYQNSNFTRFQFESFYCTIKWTVPKITPHSDR